VSKDAVGNRKLILISLVLMAISCVALVSYPNSGQNSVQISAYATYAMSDEKACSVAPRLVSANTEFAFDLFKELLTEDTSKNVFISPLSVSIALAMLYNGAEGRTKDAMAKTLNFGNMTLEEINQEYSTLIQSLENVDQAVNLLIGNSVWMKQEFAPLVKPSFTHSVGTSYNSEVFTRDFSSPQTVNEINGWVDRQTEGKIKQIVNSLSPELVMLLINAIYFKGTWTIQFDKSKTQKQDFFLSDGGNVTVNMMSTSGNFTYYSDDTCQIARLPYGRDKVAMYIFLPREGVSLDSFVAGLSQTVHDEYISRLQPLDDLTVKMPKFQVEYGVKPLNNALSNLGMGIAFDPVQADFSGIASLASVNLYISYVNHKAVVEVNEEGTEAAAVTVIGIYAAVVMPKPSFVVNRPFYYEIRDDRSGSILFMGEMLNPDAT
jgi:serine protease inhibitor